MYTFVAGAIFFCFLEIIYLANRKHVIVAVEAFLQSSKIGCTTFRSLRPGLLRAVLH